MSRTNTLGKTATSVRTDNDGTHVRYHRTDVVTFTPSTITLRTGGYRTVTTKRRMNQAAQQFGLAYSVYQNRFDWYVCTPDGRTLDFDGETLTFERAAIAAAA